MLRLRPTLFVFAFAGLLVVPPWDVARGQPAKPRLDNFGDPLPKHALARLGTTRLRQGYYLKAVTYARTARR